jgi:uncharacterized spore protein YtfJ
MAEKITSIVKSLLDGMHSISQTETVVGEPAQVGGATVIPVHRLRVGFMAGAIDAGGRAVVAEGKTGARGVGGVAQVDPVAVLAIGPDGRPRLLAVDGDAQGTWQGLIRDTPDLVTRLVKRLAERLTVPSAPPPPPAEEALPAAAAPAELPEKK